MRKNFSVPVLPYLKKYTEKHFFAGLKGPHKIEEDTLLGKQFMSIIIDARSKDFIDKHLEFTASLDVTLSESMAKRSPNLKKLICINFFLDKLFKDALVHWIKSADHFGIRPYPSSKMFLEYYGIEEAEYSHDAAYAHWKRYKNSDFLAHQRTKKRAAA
jgi:hypothetical protein